MTSTSPPRYVVLDDTDLSITYTGPGWANDTGSQDNIGTFGLSYQHTLHKTTSNGTVSLNFNGTAIRVYGTNLVKDPETNPDPAFECFIDDESIGRIAPSVGAANNWEFCEKAGLQDGLHELRIEVKVLSLGQAFWLDRILYLPSPGVPLDNKVIYVENTDPAIHLDEQWVALGDTANMTTKTNSSAEVDFIGTSVSWVAFIPTELPHNTSSGEWSIDGGSPTTFVLEALPEDSQTKYNQFYFTTPDVEAGHHTLSVTFLGSQQTTPLCLDYLYIKNGTFASSSNGMEQANPNPTSNPQPTGVSAEPAPGPNAGLIVGCTIGGLAFLLLVFVVFFFYRRRRFRRYEKTLASGSFYADSQDEIQQKLPPIFTKPRITEYESGEAVPPSTELEDQRMLSKKGLLD